MQALQSNLANGDRVIFFSEEVKAVSVHLQMGQHIRVHKGCIKIETSCKNSLAHGLFKLSTNISLTMNQVHELSNGKE